MKESIVLNLVVLDKERFNKIFSGEHKEIKTRLLFIKPFGIANIKESYAKDAKSFTMEINEIIDAHKGTVVIKLGSLLQTYNF